MRILIEKCEKYNIIIHVSFFDYHEALGSVKIWKMSTELDNARKVFLVRVEIIKNCYGHTTLHLEITEYHNTYNIFIERVLRQGVLIFGNLFTLAS